MTASEKASDKPQTDSPASASPKASRRLWLKALIGLGTAGIGAWLYMRCLEPGWLRVSRHPLPTDKFRSRGKLRFLHLSDFHASSVVPFELIENAVDLGLAEKPDAIFLTGDFITTTLSEEDFERFAKILYRLSAQAPTFACMGNHDGGLWAGTSYGNGYPTSKKVESLLKKAGIEILVNRSKKIVIKGEEMTVVGIGDLWNDDHRPAKALSLRNEKPPHLERNPILVLSHNPDSKESLAAFDWDLMLCGHTHGGQCILPLFGTPFAPVKDHRFVEGLHEWQERLIHVTRGVGNLHGMRFNCRPEISLLETTPSS